MCLLYSNLLKKVNQALMVGRLDKTENHEKWCFWGSFRDFFDFLRHPKVVFWSQWCTGTEILSIGLTVWLWDWFYWRHFSKKTNFLTFRGSFWVWFLSFPNFENDFRIRIKIYWGSVFLILTLCLPVVEIFNVAQNSDGRTDRQTQQKFNID